MNVSSILIATVLLVVTTLYLERSLGRWKTQIRDRIGAVMESLGVVAVLCFAQTNIVWPSTSPVVWIIATIEAAGGVFFLARRWSDLPVRKPGRLWVRIIRVVVGALIAAGFIGLAGVTWTA